MRNFFPCHQEKVVTCTVRCNNYNPLWSPYSLTLELEKGQWWCMDINIPSSHPNTGKGSAAPEHKKHLLSPYDVVTLKNDAFPALNYMIIIKILTQCHGPDGTPAPALFCTPACCSHPKHNKPSSANLSLHTARNIQQLIAK